MRNKRSHDKNAFRKMSMSTSKCETKVCITEKLLGKYFFWIGNDKEIYWKKKEVQEKDEKFSHQRKLNYKNTKTRKNTEKQASTQIRPILGNYTPLTSQVVTH